ncbi:MAG TPA: metallopeptidase TldD-related protein [Candidatus Acidoferrales bacterium]|nr:metallopeptidase TldD-related protein [Candidatus Acidoferrales bacterium]
MSAIRRASGVSRGLAGLTLAILLAGAVRVAAEPHKGAKLTKTASASAADASADPILAAMRQELDRSKSQLKMDNVLAPYYIEYRLTDFEQYSAEAAFGALRENQRSHARSIRVVVRVGDYKQDSYYGPGVGAVDLAPLENDSIALRRQLWNATDSAYKRASEALAQKKATLRQYASDQPFDDFAHTTSSQSIEPLAKLDFDPKPWTEILEKSTALFRTDPKMETLSAGLRFRCMNEYFVNTEGTVTRHGYAVYTLTLAGATQATDGMTLERSPYYVAANIKEMPTAEQVQADAAKMVATLKALREAPVVDEDYRGPVLFSSDAATDIFYSMIGGNVLGVRPKPGDSARTTGDFASNYKGPVLPAFLSVVDDPTLKTFQGKTLTGSYDYDDEGVRAVKVPVIQDGVLVNYLMGREPIRDFPESNGHGRAAAAQAPSPTIGNLIVESKQPLSPEDLKKKLIEICSQEGKPFGYYVETLAGFNPRLLYRVYADGHEELVRGAVFDELDARTLRHDLVAAGNDSLVSNRESAVPSTVIAPSFLIDELEVKRTDAKNAKLPEYPPPDLGSRP